MEEFIGLILKKLPSPQAKESFILYYLQAHWQEIVGNVAAQHSQPVQLYEHVLMINTDNPAWSNNLLMLQKQLLSKIKQILPIEVGKKRPYLVKSFRFKNGSIKDLPVVKEDDAPFIPKLDSTRLCPFCGVKLFPGEEKCSHCARLERQGEKSKIHKILCDAPWYEYRDCAKYLKCDKIDFAGVKAELQEAAIKKALEENSTDQDKFFAVMLVLGKKPTEIDDELVSKSLKSWKRRRIYVSSFRKQLSSKE